VALYAGSRLGPYEVISPLGSGGMGEVYRARDGRLGRDVAIKVLPAAVASDPARLTRFEREARSASALNHPNIVTIYDIGSADAVSYIAMELVQGESLRQVLAAGALPVKRLLQIGIQIADGLAKAHAVGIVHRDLKPENVMVNEDGLVKILDFGLAKLTQPQGNDSDTTQAPTVSGATEEGTILGTVGYMAPEQARSGSIDYRSDQFSLGSILYEMAAGRRAFHRASAPETLTAIILEDPEPIASVNPTIPAPLRWIVERCLAKEPRSRYASTEDLARDLATVRDHLSEASSAVSVALAPVRRARRELLWVAGTLAAVALAVGATLRLARSELPAYRQLTYRRGTIWTARFAPGGQTVVYGAAWSGKPFRLFTTTLTGPESRSLDLPDADVLSVSSAGEMAISLGHHFHHSFKAKGTLAQVSLAGGAPRPLAEDVEWADWLPGGQTLAIVREVGGKDRLECPMGKILYETPGWISDIRASPDGERIAFFDHPDPIDPRGSVAVVDRAGRKLTLSEQWARPRGMAWSSDGKEIWFTAGKSRVRFLQAVSLAGKVRIIARTPATLTLYDISRDGHVLIGQEGDRVGIMGHVSGEAVEKDLSWFDQSTLRGISPDGQTILFMEVSVASSFATYIGKTDASQPVRVGDFVPFELSPDGSRVLGLVQSTPNHLSIYPVGLGEPLALPEGSVAFSWASWLPDGKSVLAAGSEPGHGRRLYLQDLRGGPVRAISPEGVTFSWDAASPDGQWAVARSPDGNIALYPVGGGSPKPVPGVTREDEPIGWTDGGKSLFASRRGELPAHVVRVDVATGQRTPWRELIHPDPAGVTGIIRTRISPDGKSYAYSYFRLLSELYVADGLK